MAPAYPEFDRMAKDHGWVTAGLKTRENFACKEVEKAWKRDGGGKDGIHLIAKAGERMGLFVEKHKRGGPGKQWKEDKIPREEKLNQLFHNVRRHNTEAWGGGKKQAEFHNEK